MKFKIENPMFDCQLFQATNWLDNWDASFRFGSVVAKHHVGPHAAGEVVFDSATINIENRKITYQGPRTGLPVEVETGHIDANENEATVAQEAPYADGCDEATQYTYQLILSVGAQIAQETP